MGIKGIKKLIKKHVPEAISPISIHALKGKTICIDSSILLYKFRYTYEGDNFHILGFLHKTIDFLEKGIKPIYVFDGKPPEEKRQILNKRKEQLDKRKEQLNLLKQNKINDTNEINDTDDTNDIDEETKSKFLLISKINLLEKNTKTVERHHSVEVVELLKCIGIPFFESNGEAEESCVFLQKNGYADYILSEDTDCLTFGGTNILFNIKSEYFICSLDKVLKGFELIHDEFIDLCILCGCDYTCTIPKIGPVTALSVIKKYRSIENLIKINTYKLPENFDYLTARKLFKENSTTQDFLIRPEFDKTKYKMLLSKYSIKENYFLNLSNLKFQFNLNLN